MPTVQKNVISKHYCPECESFDLIKLHRSFIQKHIFESSNNLQCRECGEVFKAAAFEQNVALEAPVFLAPTKLFLTSNKGFTFDMSDASEEPLLQASENENILLLEGQVVENKEHSNLPESNTHVEATALPEVDSDTPLSEKMKPPKVHKQQGDIDEVILTKKQAVVWPYMLASLFVLLGTVYTFVWMPMTFTAKETNSAAIDMTIGSPMETVLENKQTEPVLAVSSMSFEKAVPVDNLVPKVVLTPEALPIAVNKSEKAVEAKVAKLNNFNPRLQADLGTKADRALGGLSSAKEERRKSLASVSVPSKTANVEVKKILVPLPKTTIRRYRVAEDKNEKAISMSSDVMREKDELGPRNSSFVINKKGLGSLKPRVIVDKGQFPKRTLSSKKTAAFLGLNDNQLIDLAQKKQLKKKVKPAVISPITKQKAQRIRLMDAKAKLSEDAAIKSMQQDLDKLLPN